MKEIIADIYNKVLTFFQTEKDGSSKEIASNRLKLVLMQDRTHLDSATLDRMRLELIDVISGYFEIDKEALGLNLAGEGESVALMLNIPILRAKTAEEIEQTKKEKSCEIIDPQNESLPIDNENEDDDDDDDNESQDDDNDDDGDNELQCDTDEDDSCQSSCENINSSESINEECAQDETSQCDEEKTDKKHKKK